MSEPTIIKTDAEWQAVLTPEQFWIGRQQGTEPAFSGEYWNTTTPGTYACAACNTHLFRSEAKFDAGCGWPSYFEPIAPDRIREEPEMTLGYWRTEVRCATCDAHLGHVFPDGPPPTGQRYCINSGIIELIPDE